MQGRKILIIGCPGGGKSTFARRLGEKTGLPVFHLDMLYWKADKTTASEAEFADRLDAVLARDAWIIDGNYASTLEKRLKRCDEVLLLDIPVQSCLLGLQARMNTARPDMPWVETEYDAEFLDFVRRFPEEVLPGMMETLKRFPEKQLTIFRSREETEEYLSQFQQASR